MFKMRKFALSGLLLTALAAVSLAQGSAAADDQITRINLPQTEIDRIVKSFTEKEGIFHRALNNYSFQRDALIQTLGFGAGQITGEYHRQSLFTFDDKGVRYEKILYFPMSTLTEITVEAADLEDLGGVNAFALEPQNAPQYTFTLLGKQKIDELNLYVFDVVPRVMPDPKKTKLRLFKGQIWVDDRDLQIVKSKGKGFPETKTSKFPTVETWRENIGGKYWFPTYAVANDTLEFASGQTVHMKLKITYRDYKEATSTVRVLDDDTTTDPQAPAPAPSPKKP
jgi:hypothetical protein